MQILFSTESFCFPTIRRRHRNSCRVNQSPVFFFFNYQRPFNILFPVSDVYPRPTRRTKRTVYTRTGSYYEIPFPYGKLQRCCTSSNEFPESQKYSNFLQRSSRDVRAGLVPE